MEACLAVIGLRTIISRKTEKVRRATLDRIDGIGKEISRLARQLVNDEMTETWYSDLNYRQMLADLSKGFELDQVHEMADQFPPEYRDVGHALSIAASQVMATLATMIPTSVYTTITGPTQLLPDDLKLWKFVSILEVLDAPLMAFPLMATGALLRSQASAVRALYPTLSAAIDAALLDATIKAKANKKSYELPPRAEVGVKAWMGQGPVSPGALRTAQSAVKGAKDKQAARVQQQQQKSKLAGMSETQAQRSDMKAP